MTIYIPQFWLGVMATLLSEFIVILVASRKHKNGGQNNEDDI